MYIRYLGNVHNIKKYHSLVKSVVSAGQGKNNCIHLQKNDGFFSLEFLNQDSRDHVLNLIWEEMSKGTKCFDIDGIINTYYEAKKYNL